MQSAGQSLDRCLAMKEKFTSTIENHQSIISPLPTSPLDTIVHFRIRPLSETEMKKGYYQVVFSNGQESRIYVPSFQVLTDPCLDVHSFGFSGNHGETVTQEQFLSQFSGQVDWVLKEQGILAIFAFGQTGSGKTYTMSALAEQVVNEVPFDQVTVHVSLMEILGDQVRDLASHQNVRVMIDSSEVPVIVGATQIHVKNQRELWTCINHGFDSRKTSGTSKNATSSRSHFICRLQFEQAGQTSELLLVDLAGSERHADSKDHDPEQLKESIAINASLMALKECIRARSSDKRIPYRSSKLTMILKEVLCPSDRKTQSIMIATVAPTIADCSHSLQTFRYACSLNPKASASTEPTPIKTPMSWSIEKLKRWISVQSRGKSCLNQLLDHDLDRDGFKPPPWKHLYDLPVSLWIERKGSEELRNAYKALFKKPRATVKASGLTDGHVETICLLEPPRLTSTRKLSRSELAMEKLRQRGQQRRSQVK